ncbi:MAG: hypothetical protein ABS69_00830 [Nitrosomonadales bacterium SCN 54-20]|nr:MAG: hypothetical protein ABS69_00830 [Nitrosomonadales bacterium SCN 54-20]
MDAGEFSMEVRMAKLEAHVEHMQSDISEIKADLRDFRKETKEEFVALRKETREDSMSLRKEMYDNFASVRKDARSDFRLLFGALIFVALGLAGIMAKGFGWL